MDVVAQGRGAPSRKFSLVGTEELGNPKRLVTSDATDELEAHIPRLVRVRSYDWPFVIMAHEGFALTGDLRRFQVPGGNATTKTPGFVEFVCYGGIVTLAYAIQSRAVANAEMEIIPYNGHVAALPSHSDQVTLSPDGDDPGTWTVVGALSSGWQPGGRPHLSLVSQGAVEVAFFNSADPQTLVTSWTVDGVGVGTVHPAPYQLYARHPGGGSDDRTLIATWTRGSG